MYARTHPRPWHMRRRRRRACVAQSARARRAAFWSPIVARYDRPEARLAPPDRGVLRSHRLQEDSPGRRGNTPGGLFVCPVCQPHRTLDHSEQTHPYQPSQGVIGDVRHPGIHTETDPDPGARLAGRGALQRRHRLARRAVLLRAARRHRRGQGVLPGLPGEGRRASRARSSGASRGACGAASCS